MWPVKPHRTQIHVFSAIARLIRSRNNLVVVGEKPQINTYQKTLWSCSESLPSVGPHPPVTQQYPGFWLAEQKKGTFPLVECGTLSEKEITWATKFLIFSQSFIHVQIYRLLMASGIGLQSALSYDITESIIETPGKWLRGEVTESSRSHQWSCTVAI